MTSQRAVWPWYGGAVALIILDQLTKIFVRSALSLHESVRIIGKDLVRLTYVLNPGIAFGVRVSGTGLLLVFGWIAAIVLAAYLFILVRRGDALRWPVMLFLAGAIGNSIDRTLFGQVTDFLDVDFPNFIMDRWPVFNVADSCVTIGIVWMIALILLSRRHASAADQSLSSLGGSSVNVGSRSGTNSLSGEDGTGPAAHTH
jgi:signal peptidase II